MACNLADRSRYQVDTQTGHLAYTLANRVVQDMEEYSQILQNSRENEIPAFEQNEIVIGDMLGTGGFNQVLSVERLDLIEGGGEYLRAKPPGAEQQVLREQMASECSQKKYAIKFLKTEAMEDVEDYSNGAADLMVETKLLSSLDPHPNIITLHGVASAGTHGFADGTEGAYFLILDRLTDTLENKLVLWRDDKTNTYQRIKTAFDISSALAHLHAHRVIFRDLKPDNVGFDIHNGVKLFDFGLAKELDPRQQKSDETYDMSSNTGSRRYMAPEVVVGDPYGLGADVYSFGVLLWEIVSLDVPYEGMSLKDHQKFVVAGGERPPLDENWSDRLKNIFKWSWITEQDYRPPMLEIRRALKTELKSQNKSAYISDQPDMKKSDKMSMYIETNSNAKGDLVVSALSAFQQSCTLSDDADNPAESDQ
mmetsp:Transcript_18552/g.28638  ORF Transcript_18552/g.28638 Transcript_18552/m.28638 type:complete len:423 (-) Transcript_18552:574-1842(-)|eukprot:CAMPEP_0195283080 /NCGR_PEP_ID=MMETSP0707-20130614/1751_1 /TAXON_ID=33640 /ORGANISM="Asterionellopsis glacialis, Strain CCMP134" /LENGTH=422 /DNA_ID=CAMNT_0040342191 /DNA_START=320 /DNA_END=1588 /DNA_ORIENTATION=+